MNDRKHTPLRLDETGALYIGQRMLTVMCYDMNFPTDRKYFSKHGALEHLERIVRAVNEHQSLKEENTRLREVNKAAMKAAAALSEMNWHHPDLQELRALITPTMKGEK